MGAAGTQPTDTCTRGPGHAAQRTALERAGQAWQVHPPPKPLPCRPRDLGRWPAGEALQGKGWDHLATGVHGHGSSAASAHGAGSQPHPTVGTGGPPAPWEGRCRAGRSRHRAAGGRLGPWSPVNMNCPDVPCGGQGSPVPATPGPRGPGEPCQGWEEMSSEAGLKTNRPGLARGMEAFSESTVTTKLQTQPGG